MIAELIDKKDGFEIVRDQIAGILANETANQQTLAAAASKESSLWKLRIYSERTNPIEDWLDPDNIEDKSPIVNVWFDNESVDASKSNTVRRQMMRGTFNIDCYGLGISSDDVTSGGHNPGDEEAALNVQRAVRLVRNILMAAEYVSLGIPKPQDLISQRMPQSITMFQPEIQGFTMQHVHGARFALRVDFNEVSPQITGEPLELISIDILRQEDGEILAEADYDFTA